MLILKRKMGEGIDVGDNVRIVLKEINGGHVKIGIEAPTDIRVKRSEITISIEEENLRAANSFVPIAEHLNCLDGIAEVKRPDHADTSCATSGGDAGCFDEVPRAAATDRDGVKR